MPRDSSVTVTITVTLSTTALGFNRDEELTEASEARLEEGRDWLNEKVKGLLEDAPKGLPEVFKKADGFEVETEAEAEAA